MQKQTNRIVICGLAVLATHFIAARAGAAIINVPRDQPTIQAGIDAAVSGVDEVVVAPGTYEEIIDFNGKAITLRSSGGAAMTIIDATNAVDPGDGKPVVRCDTGEGPDTVLDGFTITGGTGHVFFSTLTQGGGMFNDGTSPTVTNCVFIANTVTHDGGGMYNSTNSSPTITNCVFSSNSATGGGGLASFGSPTMANCTFTANSATIGAGVALNNGIITDCVFVGNMASSSGGGVSAYTDIGLQVSNCTFSGNSAGFLGGGMELIGLVTLTHCTLSANTCDSVSGAGVSVGFDEEIDNAVTVDNCIFWDNSNSNGFNEEIDDFDGVTTVRYSNVQGGWTGAGTNNIDADPLFVDADGADDTIGTDDDNVRLTASSPCIDAGDAAATVTAGLAADADGLPRAVDDPDTANTGVGAFGLYVDMGPYEIQVQGGSDCPADLNGSGIVDTTDLLTLFANWGPCK